MTKKKKIEAPNKKEIKKPEIVKPIKKEDKLYLMQEANLIGTRIQWYLEQHEKIETLGLFSTGALWAFIMSQNFSQAVFYIAWVPLLVSSILFIKSFLFTKTIREAFQYMWEIEEEYNLPKGKGWVHYFREKSSKYKSKWRIFFWITLNLVNILIPLLFPFELILKSSNITN